MMIQRIVACLVAVLAIAGLGPTRCGRAAEPVVVEVDAGKFDRQDVLVSADIPASLRSAAGLALVPLDGQGSVPVQVDRAAGRVWWMLHERLAAGQVRHYRLQPAAAADANQGGVSVRDDGRQLVVSIDGKPVLTYNEAVIPSPDPKEPYYARSGYIHPVFSPSGQVVTDDFHPDHAHQHGIMFAWRQATFEGRQSNCWEQKDAKGRVEHVKVEAIQSGPVFGGFTVRLRHVSLTVPGAPRPMLDETWHVRIARCCNPFVFDFESVQTCAGSSPLVVEKYHYGGLAVRGARSWGEGKPPRFDFLTSDGKARIEGNQTRPRWVEFFGPSDGQMTGILVLDDPGNFGFPQPVRLHPSLPYFCFVPAALGQFVIAPGKPYVSRYRFCPHDGTLTSSAADRLWHDYADPPKVTVSAR